jgi:signal transduction histidine kinase
MRTHLTDAGIVGKAVSGPTTNFLGRLRWLTIVLAIAFLVCVQAIAMGLVMPNFGIAYGHIVSMVAYSAGVIIFTTSVFRVIDGMQARILQKNEELEAINAVSSALAGSLDSERTVCLALENVMAISGSIAGEITILDRDSGEPRRFALGDAELMSQLGGSDRLEASSLAGEQGNGRIVEIPLAGLGEEIGVMRLLPDESSQPSASQSVGLLESIGAQIAVSVMAGQLHEDVLRRQVNSQALYEIAVEITSAQDPRDVLWSITERARELLNAESAWLSLHDQTGSGKSVVARSGHTDVAERSSGSARSSWTRNGNYAVPGRTGSASVSRCAPLNTSDTCIGEICVSGSGLDHMDDEDEHLLAGIAGLAAIAVQKSRLMEQSRQVAVLQEREWLAREMHDSLAQVLGYLHLKSQAALGKLGRNDLPHLEDELREMTELAKEGYADVREAIFGLRETVTPSAALEDVLREYVLKFSRRTGVNTALEVKGEDTVQLSPEAQAQVIRVVQEALTNVRKHARATKAGVSLDQSDGLTITIEDNGNGFEPGRLLDGADKFGLWTMRERAERVGGLVEIDSAPGCGTRVRVTIPANEG